MRLATVDGLVTLFYDGSKELYNHELHYEWKLHQYYLKNSERVPFTPSGECKQYMRARQSWQQVVIVDGVTEIPEYTFYQCKNLKRVIFADTVISIEERAFYNCSDLKFVILSINLECIGREAFRKCNLFSVFIPPSCREIGGSAFSQNKNLVILNVPQNIELGPGIVKFTGLVNICPFSSTYHEEFNAWLKSINDEEKFTMHRVCSSFHPTLDMIVNTMKDKGGPKAFKVKNIIGITPSQYLEENPYVDVNEKDVIERYILQMVGEL